MVTESLDDDSELSNILKNIEGLESIYLYTLSSVFQEDPDLIKSIFLEMTKVKWENLHIHISEEYQNSIQIISKEIIEDERVKKLLTLIFLRDHSTLVHSVNTMVLCMIHCFNNFGKFSEVEKTKEISIAALMHDIGKIDIDPTLLRTPFKLSDKQFEKIKRHPKVGYEILKELKFSEVICDVALCHHERLDGTGYPYGKLKSEISYWSRFVSATDIFEAMTSWRPYKTSKTVDVAIEEIKRQVGIGKIDKDIFECLKDTIILKDSDIECFDG